MPVPKRVSALPRKGCPSQGPRRLTRRFHRLSAARGWVAYALRTRPPLSPPRRGDPARLACIRPAASVHPEPGSNSSLYYCFSVFLFRLMGSALLSLFLPVPPRPTLTARRGFLCWPQAFKELPQTLFSVSRPSSFRLRAAKIQPFYLTASTFFKYFSSNITFY